MVAVLPLLAAVAAATPAPPADDRALFAAFRGVCSNVRKLDAMQAAAKRGKWQAVEPSAHPNLQLLVEQGLKAAKRDEPDATYTGGQYRKMVGGRSLWMVLSRYRDSEGYWSNGCRIYHFEATAALPGDELTQLMGKSPSGTQPLPDDQVKYLWEPGWRSGHSVEISYIVGNDATSRKYGLKGQVLMSQAIGTPRR
ncbi:hypothetical protein [Novosphingobium sp. B 225]|uniref:hypothetical protein n=1 Tax=Novosphingobium sp. B 225 TaxID=1961849 RepID=UPI000B4AC3BE|nr:hypothetical protein [Novosphingobium sp. B 225]